MWSLSYRDRRGPCSSSPKKMGCTWPNLHFSRETGAPALCVKSPTLKMLSTILHISILGRPSKLPLQSRSGGLCFCHSTRSQPPFPMHTHSLCRFPATSLTIPCADAKPVKRSDWAGNTHWSSQEHEVPLHSSSRFFGDGIGFECEASFSGSAI
jgi:hypothetical protein